jgi:hypothetical protein
VERIDGCPIWRRERKVQRRRGGHSFLDPEVTPAVGSEADRSFGALNDADVERL